MNQAARGNILNELLPNLNGGGDLKQKAGTLPQVEGDLLGLKKSQKKQRQHIQSKRDEGRPLKSDQRGDSFKEVNEPTQRSKPEVTGCTQRVAKENINADMGGYKTLLGPHPHPKQCFGPGPGKKERKFKKKNKTKKVGCEDSNVYNSRGKPSKHSKKRASEKLDQQENPAAINNNAKSPEISSRPRDSPSRYGFRELNPTPPLISENADKNGCMTAEKVKESKPKEKECVLQQNLILKKVPTDEVSSSPVAAGNIDNVAQDVEVPKAEEMSPPSSTSTMSSTNIQQLLSDFTEIGTKSEGESVGKITSFYKLSDAAFAPVDVTKNNRYVFCASQSTNSVEVFGFDGKSAGKLRLYDHKKFDKPRNVLHIPQCNTVEEDSQISPLLNAGCIVVLDECGFHVFSENGQHLGTILEGLGNKYRGLSFHRRIDGHNERLYLITIDISGPESVYLSLIDLKEALRSSDSLAVDKILVACLPDESLKCRFVTTMADTIIGYPLANSSCFAYVSALKAGEIYKINLETKTSTAMELFETSLDSNSEFTFVDKKLPFKLKEPTGLAIDKDRNLLVADRTLSNVIQFTNDGTLVTRLQYDGKTNLHGPIGIHFCHKEKKVFIASNRSKTVFLCEV